MGWVRLFLSPEGGDVTTWEMCGRRWKPIPLHDLSQARCVGRWQLFDSLEVADHAEARAICAECPALLACRAHVNDVLTASMSDHQHGVVGTWAGLLFGRQGKRRPRVEAAHNGVIRGRIKAAQTEECDLPNLGLAPVLRTQNGG